MKKNTRFLLIVILLILLGIIFFMGINSVKDAKIVSLQEKTKGIMILIEYKDTIGLANFVNEMQKRDIYSLLQVDSEFVEANCDTIKKLTDYNVELVAANIQDPF
ncbi:MAG: hypothetical protein PHP14_03570 [Candidatus Pacebacteria bacterium]|nr:hypothetical protein [Candidatus Paceibacterota bacterium]MDD3808529.1 hypothetical protein [Candidatus Paceibacterota bacterium]